MGRIGAVDIFIGCAVFFVIGAIFISCVVTIIIIVVVIHSYDYVICIGTIIVDF